MSNPSSVVTSWWYARLPESYARIGISRQGPRGQRGFKMYKALAPGAWFKGLGAEEYRRLYMRQLSLLNPQKVLAELRELADGLVPSLMCFEKPPPDPAWCHRGLVSAWFKVTLGIDVPEFGHETLGSGWAHPKLPAQWKVCLRSPARCAASSESNGAASLIRQTR